MFFFVFSSISGHVGKQGRDDCVVADSLLRRIHKAHIVSGKKVLKKKKTFLLTTHETNMKLDFGYNERTNGDNVTVVIMKCAS